MNTYEVLDSSGFFHRIKADDVFTSYDNVRTEFFVDRSYSLTSERFLRGPKVETFTRLEKVAVFYNAVYVKKVASSE